jgi:hypothetical protein
MLHPFVNGDSGAYGKDQNGDDEAPKVDFPPMAEGELLVGGLLGSTKTVEEQDLVACVHDRVDSLGEHGRASRDSSGDEFGQGNEAVTDKRRVNDFFGSRSHLFVPFIVLRCIHGFHLSKLQLHVTFPRQWKCKSRHQGRKDTQQNERIIYRID